MAVYQPNIDEPPQISIPYTVCHNSCTYYVIIVKVTGFSWEIERRYAEFYGLHKCLVNLCKIAKDSLPPKNIIGFHSPKFIEQRRLQLETYLKNLCEFLYRNFPIELLVFLGFDKYEAFTLLRIMAKDLYNWGDQILLSNTLKKVTPLELYAITVRLQSPVASSLVTTGAEDFSHILDFTSQERNLHIIGSEVALNRTNIIPNKLNFDLNMFKQLHHLCLECVSLKCIVNFSSQRSTVRHLEVLGCKMSCLAELFLCDTVHQDDISHLTKEYKWLLLENFLARNCQLRELGTCINLLPNIAFLDLSNNCLTQFENLTILPRLTYLNLSVNEIKHVENLNFLLGNLTTLNLSQNQISSLAGFQKLYSLNSLDLSHNLIESITEAIYLTNLPCLEILNLTGNPITQTIDYRTRLLAQINAPGRHVRLDNEDSSPKELDTVAILQALEHSWPAKQPHSEYIIKN